MPGREEERRNALEEGVKFRYPTAPIRFLGDNRGQVVAAECVTMDLRQPDASGRRRPEPLSGSEFLIEADTVVLAVGYGGDQAFPAAVPDAAHQHGLFLVDPETGMTNVPGVFAGGDNVRGADLVVTAIAEAKTAAHGILQYLARHAPVV